MIVIINHLHPVLELLHHLLLLRKASLYTIGHLDIWTAIITNLIFVIVLIKITSCML